LVIDVLFSRGGDLDILLAGGDSLLDLLNMLSCLLLESLLFRMIHADLAFVAITDTRRDDADSGRATVVVERGRMPHLRRATRHHEVEGLVLARGNGNGVDNTHGGGIVREG